MSGHTFRFRWTVQDLEVFLVWSNSPLAVKGLRTVFSSQDSTNVESAFLRMARELKNGYEGESHLQAIDDGRVLLESRKVGKWGCCT